MEDLRKTQKELEDRLYELECQKQEEQEDVDKLEQTNVINVILKVTGHMKELLEAERKEAGEVLERYEAVCNELEDIKKDIRHHEMEYGRVRKSEENYELVLKQKVESLKSDQTPEAAEIKRIEERLMQLGNEEQELNETISTYNSVKYLVEDIIPYLAKAEGWSKYDLLGCGTEGEMEKYRNLNKAQEMFERMRKELSQLKTKNAVVKVPENMHLNFDRTIKCLDYLKDNIFIDYAIMNEIKRSHSELRKYGEDVESFLIQLSAKLTSNKQTQNQLKGELDRLVRGLQI